MVMRSDAHCLFLAHLPRFFLDCLNVADFLFFFFCSFLSGHREIGDRTSSPCFVTLLKVPTAKPKSNT